MKKKLLWKLMAAFFILLIVCTIISNAVYNAKLPVVTLSPVTSMTLEQHTTVTGELYYQDTVLCVRYSLSAADRETYETPDIGTVSVKSIVTDAESGNESLITESLELSAYSYHYNEKTGQFDVVASVEVPEGELLLDENAVVELAVGVYVPHLSVVPAYCVHNDSEGEYVFILMEQESLFGIENYVLRVDTEVEARSDIYVALSSPPGKQVVATSTLPLDSGDVVVVQ